MKRKWLYLAILLALLLGAATLQLYPIVQRHRLEESLSARINQQMTGATATLNFKAITDFDWDHLFIFDSYVSKAQIERALGTTFTGSMSIESNKAINLLVFMKDGNVVKFAELSRRIDFVLPDASGKWSAEEAIFDLSRAGNWIVARPKPLELRAIRHIDERGK